MRIKVIISMRSNLTAKRFILQSKTSLAKQTSLLHSKNFTLLNKEVSYLISLTADG